MVNLIQFLRKFFHIKSKLSYTIYHSNLLLKKFKKYRKKKIKKLFKNSKYSFKGSRQYLRFIKNAISLNLNKKKRTAKTRFQENKRKIIKIIFSAYLKFLHVKNLIKNKYHLLKDYVIFLEKDIFTIVIKKKFINLIFSLIDKYHMHLFQDFKAKRLSKLLLSPQLFLRVPYRIASKRDYNFRLPLFQSKIFLDFFYKKFLKKNLKKAIYYSFLRIFNKSEYKYLRKRWKYWKLNKTVKRKLKKIYKIIRFKRKIKKRNHIINNYQKF